MIAHGIDLKEAFRVARRMGCEVEMVRQSGEARITHPLLPKPCVVNSRRKDASRYLVVWLRRLVERQEAQRAEVQAGDSRPATPHRRKTDQNVIIGEPPCK